MLSEPRAGYDHLHSIFGPSFAISLVDIFHYFLGKRLHRANGSSFCNNCYRNPSLLFIIKRLTILKKFLGKKIWARIILLLLMMMIMMIMMMSISIAIEMDQDYYKSTYALR